MCGVIMGKRTIMLIFIICQEFMTNGRNNEEMKIKTKIKGWLKW